MMHASGQSGLLPPGWQSGIDPASGVVYYCNPSTNTTQWEHPGIPSAPAAELQPLSALFPSLLQQSTPTPPQSQPQPQPLESPADSSAAAAATTGKRDSTEDGPTEHGENRQQKKQKAAEPTTSSVDEFGPDGMTALQRACEQGQTGVAKTLLASKASLDLKSFDGLSALHYACMGGHKKLIFLLIQQGADPTLKTAKGLAPVSLVVGPHRGVIVHQITAAATARHTGGLVGLHERGKAPGL